ncbi:MAG: tRNA (adenosine(37)-N6)-threonylcarbamoyltransferase complex ATPase subunit type 1 TsaE [Armatimonadota bacterium]
MDPGVSLSQTEQVATSSEAMEQIGATLAAEATPGLVLLLTGELGAGKTTLARGFVRALGYAGEVRSPTFNLVFLYDTQPPVCHADLYRLNRAAEVEDIGLADYLSTHALLVEWPERAPDFWPEDAWRIGILSEPDGTRKVTINRPQPEES